MSLANLSFKLAVLIAVFFVTTSFVGERAGASCDFNYSQQETITFNTDGLYFAEFYDYIFRGHFENVKMKRENMDFLMIFEQYLRAYGGQCPDYLPKDKVEIMEQVCAMEEVTTNGYGVETNRVCIQWKWVGTGLYARSDLYNAKMKVEGIHRSDALRTTLNMIADPNAMGNSVDRIHKAKGLKNDMAQIFNLNPCNSKGVRRFEENLKRFALGTPALRMQGSSKYALIKKTGGPTGSHNLAKLLNDLVSDQSRTWAFNRYIGGSITGVTVQSKDSQGRPREVKANYSYKGFGGNSRGWVRVSFSNGLPQCIYFFDFPSNCKTPGSSIVASYAQGNYKN